MTSTETSGLEHATLTLASAIACLAESLDHMAASLQALKLPAAAPGPTSGPPSGSGGPPGGSGDDPRMKKSKAVYAICMTRKWDIGDVGERALGRPMSDDSRTWTLEELNTVLDVMKKDWGV